jgi:hypothetical protein
MDFMDLHFGQIVFERFLILEFCMDKIVSQTEDEKFF